MNQHGHDETGDARVLAFPSFAAPEDEEVVDADVVEDHPDDDGAGPGSDVMPYVPHLPALRPVPIHEARLVPTRADALDWLDRCRGGLELTTKVATFHATRSPLYAGRAIRRAHRGAARAFDGWWSWVRIPDELELIAKLVRDYEARSDSTANAHGRAYEARKRKVYWRWGITLAVLALLLLVAHRGYQEHPLTTIFCVAFGLVVLGLFGAPGEVVTHLEMPEPEFSLTTDLVLDAFVDASIVKPDRPVMVRRPGPLREGRGYFVGVTLPGGMTFEDDVKPKVRRLASGLHVARARLDFDLMEEDDEAAFGIYVSDQHPARMTVPPWPLLAAARWDIWQPCPMGQNLRGDLEELSILYTSVLVGAAPGMGKSWTARLPFLAGALDPSVQIDVFDYKGAGDWSMFARVGRVVEGASDENVEALRDFLRDDLWPDVQRRAATLKDLGPRRAPGAKVTRELCADTSLRLHVRMAMVDECHMATEHPEFGEEICDLVRKVTAQGRAVGVFFVLATQKPDANSVPSVIAANMNTRIAGRCLTHHASAAVLGSAAKSQGWEAEKIGRAQKGTVILLGAGDDAGTSNDGAMIRACLVDGGQAEEICRRAEALRGPARRPAPTVTVEALNLDGTDDPVPDIVRWVLRDWPYPDERVHQVALAEHMGIGQKQLGEQLRAAGVDVAQVKVDGVNRNGYRLTDVQAIRDRYTR